MKTTIHAPQYTHVLFTDLKDEFGVLGRFVPISEVFDVMDQTHHRPAKFVTPEGIAAAVTVMPDHSPTWRRVDRGCAWVMRIRFDPASWRPVALEAGSSSPFTVVSRATVAEGA